MSVNANTVVDGNNVINPDDNSWDQGDDFSDLQDTDAQGVGDSYSQNPLIATIQDLEQNGLSNVDPKKKPDYLNLLDEALGYLKAADRKQSEHQDDAAAKLESEGKSKYDEVMQDLKLDASNNPSDSDPVGGVDPTDPTKQADLTDKERKELADKIDHAASKIGYIKYDISAPYNIWATVAMFGALQVRDYHVQAKPDRSGAVYTVGYFNIDKKEEAIDTNWNGKWGDSSNASGGDHAHSNGDQIDQRQYVRLEHQHKIEAQNTKSALHALAQAVRESDPSKKEKAWQGALDALDKINTQGNGSALSAFHSAQLLMNAATGEAGETLFDKALQSQAIPKEWAEKVCNLIQSKPQFGEDKKEFGSDLDNAYFRGGFGSDSDKIVSLLNDNSSLGLTLDSAKDPSSKDSTPDSSSTNDGKSDNSSSKEKTDAKDSGNSTK